jgi:hypothetical protein
MPPPLYVRELKAESVNNNSLNKGTNLQKCIYEDPQKEVSSRLNWVIYDCLKNVSGAWLLRYRYCCGLPAIALTMCGQS